VSVIFDGHTLVVMPHWWSTQITKTYFDRFNDVLAIHRYKRENCQYKEEYGLNTQSCWEQLYHNLGEIANYFFFHFNNSMTSSTSGLQIPVKKWTDKTLTTVD